MTTLVMFSMGWFRCFRFGIRLNLVGEFSDAVRQVIEGQERVLENHSGTGISHDVSHLLSHLNLVAVDGAFGAGPLFMAKGTVHQPFLTIIKKEFALFAERVPGVMMFAAVAGNQKTEGFFFPFDPPVHRLSLSGSYNKK
jgi:hypothetical protein